MGKNNHRKERQIKIVDPKKIDYTYTSKDDPFNFKSSYSNEKNIDSSKKSNTEKRDLPLTSILEGIEKLPGWDKWQEVSNKNIPDVASKEAARRFYSVKYFFIFGALKMYVPLLCRPDFKFFDDSNKWYVYSNKPLQETIQCFAKFPIATSFNDKEPRLLVFSVDVAEGKTVTFDSYPKADNSRKSEYGKYKKRIRKDMNM